MAPFLPYYRLLLTHAH